MNPENRLTLSDLVHRYAALVDDRRFDDAVGLFAQDATLVLPDPPQSLEPVVRHSGHEEIRTAMSAVAAVARTQHAIVGETYTATAELARGRISCIAHHWTERDGRVTDIAWHVRYDDEYVDTNAGWRFASRTLTIDAIQTHPVSRLRPAGS
ncbi:MAG TPA: nuclear transport factor 2 family protein [Mycobacterium sp.]|nr:nuclear transport factor 2 family protein [Mycobacterium sp.]